MATLAGSTYTLTRDVMATSVTVSSGVTVRTSSSSGTYRIFCRGTVTSTAATITAAGNAAVGLRGRRRACLRVTGGRPGRRRRRRGRRQPGSGRRGPASFGVAGGAGGAGGGGGGAGGAGGAATQSGTNAVTNVFNTPFPVLNGVCGYGGPRCRSASARAAAVAAGLPATRAAAAAVAAASWRSSPTP